MFGLIFIFLVAGFILIRKPEILTSGKDTLPENLSVKIDKLWRVAQEALIDKKYLRAEKVLLTILQFDEKNATAYNRLGIIYAGQKKFAEAIECFEIAQSLEGSASSLHNVGLIYLETENYPKAALAFEQALKIEDNLATRHVAYAKALENLNKYKLAAKALESAYKLDERPQTLRALGSVYLKAGDTENAKRIKEMLDDIKGDRNIIKQNRLEHTADSAKKISM